MKIRGSGKFIVRFGLQKAYKPILWLGDHQVSLEADEACIDMPFWEDLEQGLVFVGVTAISDGEISGGGFFTNEPTRRDIKLGDNTLQSKKIRDTCGPSYLPRCFKRYEIFKYLFGGS